jgi:hypothetical protein
MLALQVVLVAAFLISALLRKGEILLICIAFAAPLLIVLASLGCWRCNYNLLRRYRGPAWIEHGDSWSGEPEHVGMLKRIPERCPKCDAVIISRSTSEVRSA